MPIFATPAVRGAVRRRGHIPRSRCPRRSMIRSSSGTRRSIPTGCAPRRRRPERPRRCWSPRARWAARPSSRPAQDFSFMGGSMGMYVGNAIIAAAQRAVTLRRPLILFLRRRRRPHAGGYPVADADAAHDRRGADAARGGAALYRRADTSDHGRRHRLLCHAGRRSDRRARGADLLRRSPSHRTDHPRDATRGASSGPNTCSTTACSTA